MPVICYGVTRSAITLRTHNLMSLLAFSSLALVPVATQICDCQIPIASLAVYTSPSRDHAFEPDRSWGPGLWRPELCSASWGR